MALSSRLTPRLAICFGWEYIPKKGKPGEDIESEYIYLIRGIRHSKLLGTSASLLGTKGLTTRNKKLLETRIMLSDYYSNSNSC